MVASLGNYIYVKSDNDIWVNLFIGSNATLDLKDNAVQLAQETNYPWDGDIQLTVSPRKKSKFSLHIRIPGWAQNMPSPGDTYRFLDYSEKKWTLTVNGQSIPYSTKNGYVVIDKEWKKGDVVSLGLPLEIRKVTAIDSIADDRNKISLQKGPLMYCFEHPDNGGKVDNIYIPDTVQFTSYFENNTLGGIMKLEANAPTINVPEDGLSVKTENKKIVAIPYFAWANRGAGQMQVWIPRKIGGIEIIANTPRY